MPYLDAEKVDEKTIVNFLSGIIESNLDDKDVYYEVNNALYQNGYSFRFEYIPKKEEDINTINNLNKESSSYTSYSSSELLNNKINIVNYKDIGHFDSNKIVC